MQQKLYYVFDVILIGMNIRSDIICVWYQCLMSWSLTVIHSDKSINHTKSNFEQTWWKIIETSLKANGHFPSTYISEKKTLIHVSVEQYSIRHSCSFCNEVLDVYTVGESWSSNRTKIAFFEEWPLPSRVIDSSKGKSTEETGVSCHFQRSRRQKMNGGEG